MNDEKKKKPMLYVIFDLLKELGEVRPFTNPYTPEEAKERRGKMIVLVEILKRAEFSAEERQIVINWLGNQCGQYAFPDIGYIETIEQLTKEAKEK